MAHGHADNAAFSTFWFKTSLLHAFFCRVPTFWVHHQARLAQVSDPALVRPVPPGRNGALVEQASRAWRAMGWVCPGGPVTVNKNITISGKIIICQAARLFIFVHLTVRKVVII